VFASALTELLEEKLVHEVSRGRLSFAQVRALQLVALTRHNTVSDVAAFLEVSNAAASKAVDRLVRGKWLRRVESKLDRRSSELSVTEVTRRLLAEYDSARERALEDLFHSMSSAEFKQATRMLDRLSSRMLRNSPKATNGCHECGIYLRERCGLRESGCH
jgi:DNA-binding MarR family transcriptional regulator